MAEFYFPEMEKYGLEDFLLKSPLAAGVIAGEHVPMLNTNQLINKVVAGSVEKPIKEFECMSVSRLMIKQLLSNFPNWPVFTNFLKNDLIIPAVFTWRILTTTHFTAVILLKQKKGWARLHSELMTRTGAPILVDRTSFNTFFKNTVGFIFDPTPFRYFFENHPKACKLESIVDPKGGITPVGLSAYPLPLHPLVKDDKLLLTFLKIDFPTQIVFLVSTNLDTGEHLELQLKLQDDELVPLHKAAGVKIKLDGEEKFLLEGKQEIAAKIAKRHLDFYEEEILPEL